MVDECTSQFPGDNVPLFPASIIILIVSSVVCMYCRAYVYHCEHWDAPPPSPEQATHTSYGLGPKHVVKTFSALGLAFAAPTLVLFFVFQGMPRRDYNAQQVACQLQDGAIYIAPLLFAYSAMMMLLANFLRVHTRHTFVDIVRQYLVPAPSSPGASAEEGSVWQLQQGQGQGQGDAARIVVIPAYRGIWVVPFAQAFEATCLELKREYELITYDCFESVYNNEGTGWIRANFALKGMPRDRTHIRWTDFTCFDGLADGSVDVFVVPLGALTTCLTGIPGKDTDMAQEAKDQLVQSLQSTVMRLLRPGGCLIASNMLFLPQNWDALLRAQSGWASVQVLPRKVWWSYIPAKVSVAVKATEAQARAQAQAKSQADAATAAAGASGGPLPGSRTTSRQESDVEFTMNALLDPPMVGKVSDFDQLPGMPTGRAAAQEVGDPTPRETVVSARASSRTQRPAMPSSSADGSVSSVSNRSVGDSNVDGDGEAKLTAAVMSASAQLAPPSQHHLSAHSVFPAGWGWRLVDALLLLSYGSYVGFVVLTWKLFDTLQVPTNMPSDQMVSALFVSNVAVIPVALYSMMSDLRHVAAVTAAGVAVLGAPGSSGSRSGFRGLVVRPILRVFLKHMLNLLLVVTLITGLGWLPYFALDVVLITQAGMSVHEVGNTNVYVSVGVAFVLVPLLSRLYRWFVHREAQQAKELTRLQDHAADVAAEAAQRASVGQVSTSTVHV